MGWLRTLVLGDPVCWCGSGKAGKFCSHRTAPAIAEGQTRNGRRVSSTHAGTRKATGAVTPAQRARRRSK